MSPYPPPSQPLPLSYAGEACMLDVLRLYSYVAKINHPPPLPPTVAPSLR